MKVKVYGCRGSLSFSRTPASKYGGNTSCIALQSGNQTLIIDAGTGINKLDFEMPSEPMNFNILLSHLHLDHTIGLTCFSRIWEKGSKIHIYTANRDESLSIKEQIFLPFTHPRWPLSIKGFSNVECTEIIPQVPFSIGNFNIFPFEAEHQDSATSFSITDGTSTLVYLLDNEVALLDAERYSQLADYCNVADLVVFDAAYTPEEYKVSKVGWGHSTIEDGFKLAKDSNCKRIMFTHFSYEYEDSTIEHLEALATARGKQFLFARDGLEIELTKD
ncbi:MAG: MBL fold metallo-hydrolase [Turicibacter sp.]|nr:MBL fold metallo-hydrolase [Turicibacter sp.]